MPSAGVDNTQRRKWDKDEYAARAAEREKAEDAKYGGKDGKPARQRLCHARLLHVLHEWPKRGGA